MHPPETRDLVGDIIALVRRLVYAPDRGLTAETRLADLGLDSLDMVEAGLELEAMMGQDLPDGAFGSVTTIGDLAAWASGSRPAPLLSLAA